MTENGFRLNDSSWLTTLQFDGHAFRRFVFSIEPTSHENTLFSLNILAFNSHSSFQLSGSPSFLDRRESNHCQHVSFSSILSMWLVNRILHSLIAYANFMRFFISFNTNFNDICPFWMLLTFEEKIRFCGNKKIDVSHRKFSRLCLTHLVRTSKKYFHNIWAPHLSITSW